MLKQTNKSFVTAMCLNGEWLYLQSDFQCNVSKELSSTKECLSKDYSISVGLLLAMVLKSLLAARLRSPTPCPNGGSCPCSQPTEAQTCSQCSKL